MKLKIYITVLLGIMCCLTARSQDVALKTNLLADGLFNPNLGIEIGLAPKWTLDVSGQFNA